MQYYVQVYLAGRPTWVLASLEALYQYLMFDEVVVRKGRYMIKKPPTVKRK